MLIKKDGAKELERLQAVDQDNCSSSKQNEEFNLQIPDQINMQGYHFTRESTAKLILNTNACSEVLGDLSNAST